MIELYLKEATLPERDEMASYFRVKEKHGERPEAKHVIACSLYWKHAWLAHGDFPVPTRELMKTAEKNDLMKRGLEPWSHYVLPLLRGAAAMRLSRPDIAFRIYLAQDLSFLIPDLLEVGCEIYVMEHNSLSHNPGAMWRLLALEETERLVTITDSDRAGNVLSDCERTESLSNLGLGHWRIPYFAHDVESEYHYSKWNKRSIGYRPIMMCQMGSRVPIPAQRLMEACIWNTKRGNLNPEVLLPGCNNVLPVYGFVWPDYGYDEWFALTSLYPRIAVNGLLTFVAIGANAPMFSLDIEYVTWANPQSEMVYFGKVGGCCPKVEKKNRNKRPKSRVLDQMLTDKKNKHQHIVPLPETSSIPDRATLVVARYNEDIEWLCEIDDSIEIVLYNKGKRDFSKKVSARVNHMMKLPNRGRESDTYLYHLQNYHHKAKNEWTIFCQGDPFPHNPDFLQFLNHRQHWSDIQPMTCGYIDEWQIPPEVIRTLDDHDWMGEFRVRTDFFSTSNHEVLGWIDHGGRQLMNDFVAYHRLPSGWSIYGYFLEQCGLMELAKEAWTSPIGQFGFAAMFAVRNHLLDQIPADCIPRMRRLAAEHNSHGYIFERLWLHLFGLPFIKFERPRFIK